MTAKVLVEALTQAGPNPTRESLVNGIYAASPFRINGLALQFSRERHSGMSLVDLSIVTPQGKFRH